ncbi:MAG: LON peptidase substrate-binding domain-containing protein [Betaproteobacteria bacterium]
MMNIPLFPLGMTLFPDGLAALKIFEVRYLDMTRSCIREGSPFGIVTLNQGSEVRQPTEQVSFADIGTLAEIINFDAIQPSLYAIRCRGQSRFKVDHAEQLPNGLWCADVTRIEEDPVLEIPPELAKSATTLQRVLQSIDEQDIPDEQRPILKPYRLNDCGWVSNRWAELLNLNASQRQHLMTLENPRLRLDLVQELLEEMGAFRPPA